MTQSQPLAGKIAFVTGAARGQGRSHALRLAQAGADIIAVDRAAPIESIPYDMATPEDLAETAALVEKLDRQVITDQLDVRAAQGLDHFGHIDVVVANAGVYAYGPVSSLDVTAERWNDILSTNVTGVFHTVKATVPSMIERGEGGSVILTSSTAGTRGPRSMADYAASKHGVVGLMRSLANELAQHHIRVNTVNPTGVNTTMIVNPSIEKWYADNPSILEEVGANLLPVNMVEPIDVSEAVVWLASDATRYVTGAVIPVDAGLTARF
jgi:SDR family mycofactocin-dependent oxidoreductase